MGKLTVADIQQMKRDGQKIVAAICYDYQMAQILDRAGVDILTVGDSVGRAMWGQATHHEVTVDQMILVCLAVTRGANRALVSCDMPFGPGQAGPDEAAGAAIRLVKEGHAEMVKIDGAAHHLEAVKAIVQAGIPVWTQFGFSPQSVLNSTFGTSTEEMAEQMREEILRDAKLLEEAGASMLDLTHVLKPEIYAEVAKTARIPVLGGSSSAGPEADGRISGFTYRVSSLDPGGRPSRSGAARVILEAAEAYVEDVRAARPR